MPCGGAAEGAVACLLCAAQHARLESMSVLAAYIQATRVFASEPVTIHLHDLLTASRTAAASFV